MASRRDGSTQRLSTTSRAGARRVRPGDIPCIAAMSGLVPENDDDRGHGSTLPHTTVIPCPLLEDRCSGFVCAP